MFLSPDLVAQRGEKLELLIDKTENLVDSVSLGKNLELTQSGILSCSLNLPQVVVRRGLTSGNGLDKRAGIPSAVRPNSGTSPPRECWFFETTQKMKEWYMPLVW